jgi:hypothetical protein
MDTAQSMADGFSGRVHSRVAEHRTGLGQAINVPPAGEPIPRTRKRGGRGKKGGERVKRKEEEEGKWEIAAGLRVNSTFLFSV